LLPDEIPRIALLKLEGHSDEEIAALVQRSLATVHRWLALIRNHGAAAMPPCAPQPAPSAGESCHVPRIRGSTPNAP
jgi:transposase